MKAKSRKSPVMTRVIGVHLLCSMSQEIAVKSHGNIHQNRHQMKRLCTGCPRRSGERRRRGSCLGIRGLLCPLHGVTFFRIQTIRLCLKILQYWAEPPPTRQFVVSHEINLVWLSRKSIIFPTIRAEPKSLYPGFPMSGKLVSAISAKTSRWPNPIRMICV